MVKDLKKSMSKKDFKNKDRKEILSDFEGFQSLTSQSEYVSSFNKFYTKYRDKSEPLKQKLQNFYKSRHKFATAFILNHLNMGTCTHKGHVMQITQIGNNTDGINPGAVQNSTLITTTVNRKQGMLERSSCCCSSSSSVFSGSNGCGLTTVPGGGPS